MVCYDKSLKIDPQNEIAWANKGVCLANLGRFKEAIECFDKALEVNPGNASVWMNKGASLGSLDRLEEAMQCLDKALELDPGDSNVWYNKPGVLLDLGRFEQAADCYDRVLVKESGKTDAWINKGICLNKLGRYEEALRCFDKALELEQQNAVALKLRALCLGRLGQPEKGRKYLEKSKEIESQRAKNLVEKGSNLFDSGQFEEAITCFEEALDTGQAQDLYSNWLRGGKLLKIVESVCPEIRVGVADVCLTVKTMEFFPKTSLLIIRLAAVLTRTEKALNFEDFEVKVDSILDTFKDEFAPVWSTRAQYTRKCFDEIQTILTETLSNSRVDRKKLFDMLLDLRNHALETDNDLRPMMKGLPWNKLLKEDRTPEESRILFQTLCHVYLVGYEAEFYDSIKTLYLFSEAAMGNFQTSEKIKEFDNIAAIFEVKQTYKQIFKMTPVFLEGKRLRKLNLIRNAIAHAQARYDPETDQVLFWEKPNKNANEGKPSVSCEKMSFIDFNYVFLEAIDLQDSLRRSIDIMLVQAFLMNSYDAVQSAHPIG